MYITNEKFDEGKPFDWGRTSDDYANYRDIYPEIFYEKIIGRNLCVKGQTVLDLGTGTGVIPRNMYRFGAKWFGIDISENQIAQAQRLSDEQNLKINYQASAAEDVDFAAGTFDVITACQCFGYFDHERVTPKLHRMLKSGGSLLILYMAWLPFEDEIAKASEDLVLKYNPLWTGAGETRNRIHVPDCVYAYFEPIYHEEYDVDVCFTRETWHGRMKACRGIGASLSPKEIEKWEAEHRLLLNKIAPEEFSVKHYAAVLQLRAKKSDTISESCK